MKICSKCHEEKSLSLFGVYNKSKDKHKEVCKACRTKEAYTYFLYKDKQRHLLETTRARAKKLGLSFDLEYEDLAPPSLCPVFGTPLVRVQPHTNGSKRFSMSIDRIDSTKGYTKDNIQIISFLANVMKHDASKEELITFADWIIKTYKDSK